MCVCFFFFYSRQIEEILEKESIDLVVLARYMQILTKDFCDKHWTHTINIHHRCAFWGGGRV